MVVRHAVIALALVGCAAAPGGSRSRAEAVQIVADMRRIVAPGGIERLEPVRIGGIEQWVSIRGFDRRNPVLLVIHGGPGHVSMATSWYFQRGWEEYFTVVQWDQRGAGKTYAANDPRIVGPTMTPERMIADAEEMVAWLRKDLGKEKIFVLGHSWGSFLGLSVALRHPEWLHAYIGMGQMTDTRESEQRGWRFAMAQAQRDGNQRAIAELQSIAGYAEGTAPIEVADLAIQRRWLGHYGGAMYGRTGFDAEAAAAKLAPEYTDEELASLWVASDFSAQQLLAAVLALDLRAVTALRCPLILLSGRHDYNVSSSVAAEWFERVTAPSKALVWFERSAHEIMNEEPGKVLVSLVQLALPIALGAGDAPP